MSHYRVILLDLLFEGQLIIWADNSLFDVMKLNLQDLNLLIYINIT